MGDLNSIRHHSSFRDALLGAGPESITTAGGYGFRVRRCAAPRNDEKSHLELHARRGLDLGAAGAEIEEVLPREAEHAGEQSGGHLLDAGVVFLDRVVEETAARRDL